MIRRTTMLAPVLILVSGAIMFEIKHQTQERVARLEALHRTVAEERQTIRVLQAEWSHRSRPDRIEVLILNHPELDLEPFQISQTIRLGRLPEYRQPKHEFDGFSRETLARIESEARQLTSSAHSDGTRQ